MNDEEFRQQLEYVIEFLQTLLGGVVMNDTAELAAETYDMQGVMKGETYYISTNINIHRVLTMCKPLFEAKQ